MCERLSGVVFRSFFSVGLNARGQFGEASVKILMAKIGTQVELRFAYWVLFYILFCITSVLPLVFSFSHSIRVPISLRV